MYSISFILTSIRLCDSTRSLLSQHGIEYEGDNIEPISIGILNTIKQEGIKKENENSNAMEVIVITRIKSIIHVYLLSMYWSVFFF